MAHDEQCRKHKEFGCSECYCGIEPASSGKSDLLSAVGLTRIQENKLKYLIKKGGNHSAVTIHVGMPDGTVATIDPFGRVTWQGI
jgi:hypothetical protein